MLKNIIRISKTAVLAMAILFAQSAQSQQVKTGLEVLRSQNFKLLEGKRVGLITNPTGVDNNLKSTIDILHEAPNVKLVALFGPEHGVRGDVHAGDKVDNMTDAKTGLPVFSLYGNTRKPTSDMLKGIDVLVYDMVGRVIQKHKINQGTKELEIDLSTYAKGVYSIRIVNESINQTKKLIVQ